MRPNQRTLVSGVIAFLVGLAPAFFVVFNMVFTDVFGLVERLWSFAYVLIIYALLGALLGYLLRAPVAVVAATFVAPAFLFLAWYTTHEPGQALLHLGMLVVAFAGAYGGAWLARRFRKPHGASAQAMA